MSEENLEATEVVEVDAPKEGTRRESVLSKKVAANGRKVAHYHMPDRRANQHGPIASPDTVFGRQTKEPCYETVHFVRSPGGFSINEVRYVGRVIVPECIANYLTQMDREFERTERNLFRNNAVAKDYTVS